MTAPTHWALRLGAKAPLHWTADHDAILRLGDTLWDDLRGCWIRGRRLEEAAEDATGDAALLAARAAYREAEAVVDAAFEVRRAWRQRARAAGSTPDIEAAIRDAITAIRAARGTLIEAARRVRATIRPQLLGIWRARDAACRSIAAGKGRRYPQLHWGQSNDILARYEIAAREAAKRGRFVRPARDHLASSIYCQLPARSVGGVRIEREGKRARVEGGKLVGTTWAALTAPGRTAAVRIERGWRPAERAAEGRWAVLTIPCGSGDLTVQLPVRLDREPPGDALVKGVRVVRRGREWHAVVSIAGPVLTPIERGSGTVYVGVGWRGLADGSLRVLYGVDDDGSRIEVALPAEHMATLLYADALQGALDRIATETVREVAAAHPDREGALSTLLQRRDWAGLRDALIDVAPQWVRGSVPDAGRHASLLAVRRAAEGDAEKQADGAARVLGDATGRRWVEGMRSKAIRRREDLYRRCARWIAEHYERIISAESDGRKLARVEDPATGERSALPLPARRQRQAAAPYSLLSAIRWAAARSGGEVVEVPAIDCSHVCPLCGSEMERSRSDSAALYLRCDDHGVWDRDDALAMALWRDHAPQDRERWLRHADAGERSHPRIARIDAEVEARLRSERPAHARLRYAAGVALAGRRKSSDGAVR